MAVFWISRNTLNFNILPLLESKKLNHEGIQEEQNKLAKRGYYRRICPFFAFCSWKQIRIYSSVCCRPKKEFLQYLHAQGQSFSERIYNCLSQKLL